MNQRKTIMAFGAHPDDIEIGMGGTLKKLSDRGYKIIMCIATIPNLKQIRKKEAQKAGKILEVDEVIFLDIPSKKFGFNRETIGVIDKTLKKHKPHSVFTHWIGDSHQDHINLSNCVFSGARHNHFNVYMYEQTIPGGITHMHFKPQFYIDVSKNLDDKLKSMRAHTSQFKKYGKEWIEGVRGRALHRGCQIKTNFAEAFEVVKIKGDNNLFS